RLKQGAWVGVGSVCKRNSNPDAIEDVLLAIKQERPDLLLHGFGLKIQALERATCELYCIAAILWPGAIRAGRIADAVRTSTPTIRGRPWLMQPRWRFSWSIK